MNAYTQRITNPVEALVKTGTENTQLREDLNRVQGEHYHLVKCLQYISEMPNAAAAVAMKGLQFRPFR